MIKNLALVDVRINGKTQQRDIDDDVVLRYKELIAADPKQMPPIDVIYDGKCYWLFDGFHRYFAYLKLGKKYIPAEVSDGTKRDAIIQSCAANKDRAFSRQKGTLSHILLEVMFPDDEWGGPKFSDDAVATWVGCSVATVGRYRKKYDKIKQTRLENTDNTTCKKTGATESTKGSEPENEDSPPVKEQMLDLVGKEVPDHLREIFARTPEILEYLKQLNSMFREIKAAHVKNDPLYANFKVDALKASVGSVRRQLRFARPYAVCPLCGADVNNAECRACSGRGWVTEGVYKAVPEDMK